MPPSPFVSSYDDTVSHCRRCGRTVRQPDPSESCHRTSEGVVRYSRCACGMAQIWLRRWSAEVLHR
ncbi:hypothetical protein ACFVMC_31665 [Nocardia sp. NPDC127579]|uniref:hypothetical protein n=1 Tax=Nocardia sp. NPDC127579 TaxID=3345402 RepID=UPI00363C9052